MEHCKPSDVTKDIDELSARITQKKRALELDREALEELFTEMAEARAFERNNQ